MKRVVNKMIAVERIEANRIQSNFLQISQEEGEKPIAGQIFAIGDLVTPGKYEVGQKFVFNPSAAIGPYRDENKTEFWLVPEGEMFYEMD